MKSGINCRLAGGCLGIIFLAAGSVLLLSPPDRPSEAPSASVLRASNPGPLQFASEEHVLGFGPSSVVVAAVDHMVRVDLVGGRAVDPVTARAGEIPESALRDDFRKGSSSGLPSGALFETRETEPETGRKSAPPLEQVTYPGVWDGVTVIYRKAAGAIVESAYRIDPGADPSDIRLRYNRPVHIDPNGGLVLTYGRGEIRESAPIAWQEIEGQRAAVSVSFHGLGESEVGFEVGAYDPVRPLLIDPSLTWNAFLGGAGDDYSAYGIAVDGSGNVFVAGNSSATWGSPVRAFVNGSAPGTNAFAAKLDSSGNLIWNTFLGGGGNHTAGGLTVDGSGSVFVTGISNTAWGTPVRAYSTEHDAYVAKLDGSGNLTWNTFLGGAGHDQGTDVAVDGSGNVFLTGNSDVTWGTPGRAYSAGFDTFAAKLDGFGNLTWNSFVGGSSTDLGGKIALDGSGNIFVSGYSSATWGTPVRGYTAGNDGFAAKLDGSGNLTWNTFLGGSGDDYAWGGLAADGSGNIYVSGEASATWGAPMRAYSGGFDAFAAKLDGSGNLTWNTFLGSSGSDGGRGGIKADGSGNVYMAGTSWATWGSPVRAYTANADAFAAKLDSFGNLIWNTFFGGSGLDAGCGIVLDGSGNIYLAGESEATWGSPMRSYASGRDAFAAKISLSSLVVTSPNGGEVLVSGSTHNITWTTTGIVANVKIEYTPTINFGWTTIVATTANTNSYAWTVPAVASTNCLVRVSEAGTGVPSDISDALFTITSGVPMIGLSKTSFAFGAEQNGTATPAGASIVTNTGTGTLNWTAARSSDWISFSPGSGTGSGVLTIGIARTDLSPGTYQGTVTVSDAAATNSPRTINVNYQVYAPATDGPPFGSFDTPTGGSTVASSIPVTGWALDNIGMQSVKIYRGTGVADRIYIGDAVFVEGARPDVEAAYPAYPQNSRAGWGYMMLTNFLPLGDGPYTLLAYGTDLEGNEALLGSKSITVANAAAVLPFGAIDTPTQGGTASGSAFFNFGWVLTPPPNSIPIDGSTITVWVDGAPLGHPSYNHYRADIATQFPGYANSNGAVGLYTLNTTTFANAVHTIAWSAQDSGGNVDGIGSRYFAILNTDGAPNPEGSLSPAARTVEEIAGMPENTRTAVYVKRGMAAGAPAKMVFPETDGAIRITIPEVTRVAVYLKGKDAVETEAEMKLRGRRMLDKAASGGRYEAYELALGQIRPLPIGASFDPSDGVFYWQPGPGFLGEYRLVFVDREYRSRTSLTIRIVPQYAKIE